MANSSVVGILKVLLTANTAEFDTAMKGVGKDLDKLGSQAGGVSSLLGKIGPALVGAFTVGAIAKVTGDFVAMAGALTDLAAKTGLSVGALQRLKFATQESGVGLDTVAAASLQLSKRLGEGNASTLGALTAVGLKYEEIRALSPEDQFFTIADALGKIGDQNDKVALTNDLLGRQGNELLPALNGHLKETVAAYERMGLLLDDEVIRAGDELGDQWLVLQSVGTALLAQVIGPMLPGLVAISKEMTHLASIGLPALRDGFNSLIEASLRAQVRLFEVATAAAQVSAKMPTLRTLFGESAKDVAYFENQTQLARDTLAGFVASGVEPAKKAIADWQGPLQVVGRALTASSAALVDRTKGVREFYNFLGERQIENVAREQEAADQQAAIWRDYYNWLGLRRMEDDAARMLSNTMPFDFVPLKAAVEAQGPEVGRGLGATLMRGVGDTFASDLGPTIMSAVTGGGNLLESAGSLVGKSLTTGLAKMFKLAGPWGELVAGLGTLLGPLLGKLFGGVSAEVKKARTELEGFQKDLRANLSETQRQEAGTEGWRQDVIAVRDAYLATGRTAAAAEAIVKQLWDTDHPERSQAAIEEINRVLEEQGRIVAANEQAAAEAAEARERELADLQGQLHDLQEQAVVDWEDMREAAQRYGVDVDALGDAFQGQRIHASAQAIIDDFHLLTKNGASVGGVLFGMREEITALIQDALKFGTALPENFRPLVAELQRSGNLVDENGEALTDISRLQFGDPIVAKLDAVNEAIASVTRRIEELAAAITGPLVAAFDRIPAVDLRFTEPRIPGAPVNVPMMAAGGIVTAPTLAMIGEGSRPEAVIPLDRLRDGGLGGGIVVLPMIPFTDPYAAAEEAARQFGRRVGGDSHGMREVLEQVIDDWMRTYSPVRA